jgi:hypothetical protein
LESAFSERSIPIEMLVTVLALGVALIACGILFDLDD